MYDFSDTFYEFATFNKHGRMSAVPNRSNPFCALSQSAAGFG